ncbi:hypothetical protein [Demequina capsici]|uniref:Uncharacterized protein n=1 Tax=Demequina capsici TaxID=3075620 RepID=A0AA96F4Y1_9MICO|nr:hypothetical protein [Demequina sp. OYTSA14]WNM23524.1 hypothetical protein RN606_09105 [Demequina sp. OYTSA14]
MLGEQATLLVAHHVDSRDTSVRRSYSFIERNAVGVWTVSLLAASLPNSREAPQTLVLEVGVEGAPRDAALDKVAPPTLAKQLLDGISAHDGVTRLHGSPAVIRSGDSDTVLEAIRDARRHATVIVASSIDATTDSTWHQIADSLTTQAIGNAAVFSICAEAVDELNSQLPATHQVHRGHVRTFAPGVDLDDPRDGLRHRFLNPGSLERSITKDSRSGKFRVANHLQKAFALPSRRRLLELDLPADVRRTQEILKKEELRVLRTATASAAVSTIASPTIKERADEAPVEIQSESKAPPSPLLKSIAERTLRIVRRWTNAEDLTVDSLEGLDRQVGHITAELSAAESQLDEAASKESRLVDETAELRARVEELELELRYTFDESVKHEREATVLRQRLARSAKPEDAFVDQLEDVWKDPESVLDVIDRITPNGKVHPAASRVVFTGTISDVEAIHDRDPFGRYAVAFWQYVRVLHDYAKAREMGFEGNVHMYITDDSQDGAKCSPDRHAGRESDTVLNNASWRAERVRPVPTSVDPDGQALMDAHFKPTHRDQVAPRLHYYDDTVAGGTGKIYVGYIGRHLTNGSTRNT